MSKYTKKHMTKITLIIAASVLLAAAVVGGTIAYLQAQSETVANKFEPGSVIIDIPEELDGGVKRNVSVENVGVSPAYIRAAIVVNWKDAEGNVYSVKPAEGTDYTLTMPENSGWFQNGEYWYYDSIVAPDNNTGILIEECRPVSPSTAPEGYTLSVEIVSQAIQAAPKEAVEGAWPVIVGPDAKLYIKG